MAPTVDMAWLAGLLEGEGCFTYECSPGIRLGMTDGDVVKKVARMFGRHVRGPYKYRANKKPVYYTELWAGPAIDLMKSLLPLMGKRRSQKIRSIVRRWRLAPGKGHKLGTGVTPQCHPDRKHYAHRLCKSCYRKLRYERGLVR